MPDKCLNSMVAGTVVFILDHFIFFKVAGRDQFIMTGPVPLYKNQLNRRGKGLFSGTGRGRVRYIPATNAPTLEGTVTNVWVASIIVKIEWSSSDKVRHWVN